MLYDAYETLALRIEKRLRFVPVLNNITRFFFCEGNGEVTLLDANLISVIYL